MTLHEKQVLFTKNVASLIDYVSSNNHSLTFGEAYRPPEMAAIYAKEGKGIVHSLHTERLAVDMNLFDSDGNLLSQWSDYERYGKYWESLHTQNRWGGYFVSKYGGKLVDSDHFEMNDK